MTSYCIIIAVISTDGTRYISTSPVCWPAACRSWVYSAVGCAMAMAHAASSCRGPLCAYMQTQTLQSGRAGCVVRLAACGARGSENEQCATSRRVTTQRILHTLRRRDCQHQADGSPHAAAAGGVPGFDSGVEGILRRNCSGLWLLDSRLGSHWDLSICARTGRRGSHSADVRIQQQRSSL